MRLALLPIIGFKNIQGESDYVMYRNMAQDFRGLEKPVFSYMCLPRFSFGQARNEPGLLNLYTEGPTSARDRGGFHDMLATSSLTFLDLFGPRNCVYPVDAVITSRTDAVPSLTRWLWDWRAGKEVLPTVIIEPQICNIPITERNETWLLSRTLGYLMGWPVFNTEHERTLALEAATKYLRPSMVQKLEGRSRVVACTVGFDDLDRAMAKHRRSERFTLFFGGRLNAAKRADKMLQIYDEFYSAGRDVDIVVCSPKGETRVDVPASVTLYRDLSRPEFLAQAARAHVYLNTSATEGFSVGFVEQVYTIPVSIVPDLPWVRSLLDEAFDQHPFVYRDFQEARAFLRYVWENYESASERVKPVRDYLRSRYDNTLVAGQLLSITEDVVTDCRVGAEIGDVQQDLLWRTLKNMKDRFSFAEFWLAFNRKTVSASEVPQLGELWRRQAYQWLTQKAADTHSGPDPEFVK